MSGKCSREEIINILTLHISETLHVSIWGALKYLEIIFLLAGNKNLFNIFIGGILKLLALNPSSVKIGI